MKKVGLGIQELSKFKEKNLIYVDKTEIIHKLIDEGDYYFLSRPRRFGKSLLVNSLKELFEGNRELFKDCWIYDQWNWDDSYPVIKISFSEISYKKHGLEKALDIYFSKLGKIHGVSYETTSYSEQFLELIEILGQKKKVAVLIDEYDKPIIDYLENSEMPQAQKNRKILKSFYAGIKDQDKYLRFFFVTGVSKFSQVSIFSDLNHLTDISVHDDYATLVGYSEDEIKKYYPHYLEAAAKKRKISPEQLMEKLREWYNGYSWDGENFMYNPYSIISFFNAKQFDNFWFETGTPTFLIKKLKETDQKISESIHKSVRKSSFNKYDIDNLNMTAIMFQTGYLTIKEFYDDENQYVLDFPNKEVKESFLHFAVKNYADSSSEEMGYIVNSLIKALQKKDMETFFIQWKSLISSITAKQLDKVKEYEGFYHSIIYIVLKIVGIQIQCEVQSNFGSTDAVIKMEDIIYVFEFKMGTAQEAIDQIKKNQYYGPYLSDPRVLYIVGFGFDKKERNLVEYLSEEIKK